MHPDMTKHIRRAVRTEGAVIVHACARATVPYARKFSLQQVCPNSQLHMYVHLVCMYICLHGVCWCSAMYTERHISMYVRMYVHAFKGHIRGSSVSCAVSGHTVCMYICTHVVVVDCLTYGT